MQAQIKLSSKICARCRQTQGETNHSEGKEREACNQLITMVLYRVVFVRAFSLRYLASQATKASRTRALRPTTSRKRKCARIEKLIVKPLSKPRRFSKINFRCNYCNRVFLMPNSTRLLNRNLKKIGTRFPK